MVRVRQNYLLDDRVVEKLEAAAAAAGCNSKNKWVELVLFRALQTSGHLSLDAELMPETRGGDRTKPRPD